MNNELDRKIAELKGWREPTQADLEEISEIESRQRRMIHHFNLVRKRPDGFDTTTMPPGLWSTSDAKAFELVDELTGQGFGFIFAVTADGRCNAEFQHPGRLAKVDMRKALEVGRIVFGDSAENTPEGRRQAICRAYIAAVTWMREKGK